MAAEPRPQLSYLQQLWRELHRFAFSASWGDVGWFPAWCARVPASCCGPHWLRLVAEFPPPAMVDRWAWFRWSVEVHNRVNRRLGKPVLPLADAAWANGVIDTEDLTPQDALGIVAVTSVSPVPSQWANVAECLNTWRTAGMEIVAVNSAREIELLRGQFPQVTHWEPAAPMRRAPAINSLLSVVARCGRRGMIINSDISIRASIGHLKGSDAVIGIRWNHTAHWRVAVREGWGLDAFILEPEMAGAFPQLPLEIGLPMWDYWLPVHLEREGIPTRWVGDPVFFHRLHAMAWSERDLLAGMKVINSHYHTNMHTRIDSAAVRLRWPFGGDGRTDRGICSMAN